MAETMDFETRQDEVDYPANLIMQKAQFIDAHEKELIKKVCSVEPILDYLLHREVINDEEYSDIRAEKTHQKKVRALLRGPINSSGALGKAVLYDALREIHPYMMQDLGAF